MKFPVCAVETRRFPVVVSPARPLFQAEATEAVMGTATQGNVVSDAATHSQSQVGVTGCPGGRVPARQVHPRKQPPRPATVDSESGHSTKSLRSSPLRGGKSREALNQPKGRQ